MVEQVRETKAVCSDNCAERRQNGGENDVCDERVYEASGGNKKMPLGHLMNKTNKQSNNRALARLLASSSSHE